MSANPKNVLLVDDDPRLLDIMETAITRDNGHIGVFTASNGSEALDILASEEIVIVVTDINMPGISGLQLLSEIREFYADIKVIIITGFGTPEIKNRAETIGCLQFLDKPFDCQYLKELVCEHMETKDTGFAGTLKQIHLIDLIQMCCQAGMSMAIKVQKGTVNGTIVIELGKIIHAVTGDLEGEPAFYEILSWPNGSFETLGTLHVPAATIDKSSQFLLMEAARIADEKGTDGSEFDEDDVGITGEVDEADKTVRVLVVDDSSIMCKAIGDFLSDDETICIAGTAKNGREALEKIETLKPDLITLDVNMPVMDGSTALKHIMIKSPCPVIIVSNVSSRSQMTILEFLRLGAVDFITKPRRAENSVFREQVLNRVKLASTASIGNLKRRKNLKALPDKPDSISGKPPAESMVVICSGVGGYADIISIASLLPDGLTSCVTVFQNMPDEFVSPFASYLNERCSPVILPVETGSQLLEGGCYIGSNQMGVDLEKKSLPPIGFICSGHIDHREGSAGGTERPNDAFLISASEHYSGNMCVVLLSGADSCSLDVLKQVKGKGATVIVQDLSTCMVPSPLEPVVSENIAGQQADVDEIARIITQWKNK